MMEFTKSLLEKFSKNICIICRNGTKETIYTYREVINAASNVCLRFKKLEILPSVGFAIKLKDSHTAGSIVLILSILNHRCYFCPVEENEILDDYGVSFFISNNELTNDQFQSKLIGEIHIFHEQFFLYNVESTGNKVPFPKNMCYSIGTTGSTGNPKIVHVPFECIMPNIQALCARFQIRTTDIIFLGTPITFDPFIVELFMAFLSGSALIITTPKIRLSPQELLKILWPKKNIELSTTILQMTPYLFRQFGQNVIKNEILGENSALRILILGGEEFPNAAELRTWLPKSTSLNKRIFNIYGITEVSCWSAIHELNIEEILGNKKIPIGDPIDNETVLIINKKETSFNRTQYGELLIGSRTRRTYIPQVDKKIDHSSAESKTEIVYRKTGDIFHRSEDGNLFYCGRLNNVIKRMGKSINLDALENKIESLCPTIENFKAICLWNSSEQKLIYCLKLSTELKAKKFLAVIKFSIMHQLLDHEKPDWIEQINEIPLNKHGKIDKKELLKQINISKTKTPVNILKRFLSETLLLGPEEATPSGTQESKRKRFAFDTTILKKSFMTLGGTSFHALSLATEIGRYLVNENDQRKLLEQFLDPAMRVADILTFLQNAETCRFSEQCLELKPKLMVTPLQRYFKLLWRVNLEKCVDATPAVDVENRYICIGSHSHLLAIVDAIDGHEISRLKLHNRIESEVVFVSSDLALIGCNSGYLYGFDFHSGKLCWSVYIGTKVKAKPLIVSDITAIVGCYGEEFNLVAVCLKKQNIVWRKKVGSKPIFSSPLRLDGKTALVCTLDGTYERLDISIGCALWTRQCSTPIFSTPAILENGKKFTIAEVGGKVHICQTESGDILHSFCVQGNIFSNLTLHYDSHETVQIIFGCHDHYLYCLNYSTAENSKIPMFYLNWKTPLDAAIYATPALVNFHEESYIISCSTNGMLTVCELASGLIIGTYELNAEVFSSPCCIINTDNELRICLGCRDNFLYCFKLN